LVNELDAMDAHPVGDLQFELATIYCIYPFIKSSKAQVRCGGRRSTHGCESQHQDRGDYEQAKRRLGKYIGICPIADRLRDNSSKVIQLTKDDFREVGQEPARMIPTYEAGGYGNLIFMKAVVLQRKVPGLYLRILAQL
jgi:hypothetical protein